MQLALVVLAGAACCSAAESAEQQPAGTRRTLDDLLPASVRASIEEQARKQAQADVQRAMSQGGIAFPPAPPHLSNPATGNTETTASKDEKRSDDPMDPSFWLQPNGAAPGAKNPMAHFLAAQMAPPGMQSQGNNGLKPPAQGFGGAGMPYPGFGSMPMAANGFGGMGMPASGFGSPGTQFGGHSAGSRRSCKCPEEATLPELLVMLNKLAVELQVRLNPGPNPYAQPAPFAQGLGGSAATAAAQGFPGMASPFSNMGMHPGLQQQQQGERPAWAKPNPATMPSRQQQQQQAGVGAADDSTTSLAAEEALTAAIEKQLLEALQRQQQGQQQGMGSAVGGSGQGGGDMLDQVLASLTAGLGRGEGGGGGREGEGGVDDAVRRAVEDMTQGAFDSALATAADAPASHQQHTGNTEDTPAGEERSHGDEL